MTMTIITLMITIMIIPTTNTNNQIKMLMILHL